MSGKWERRFDLSVPVERAWQALNDPEESKLFFHDPPKILESEECKRMRWAQDDARLPDRGEFTVVFESLESGSRITVTRYSFGEGDDAEIFGQAQGDGWARGFMDLVLYLETGIQTKRIVPEGGAARTGMGVIETDAGLRVRYVTPGSFGEQVGLKRGDWIVRIGGIPIFTRTEIWQLNTVHPPGTELAVEFIRDGAVMTRGAKLSDRTFTAWGE